MVDNLKINTSTRKKSTKKQKKLSVHRVKLEPGAVERFWLNFIAENKRRLAPYEEARALAMASASQRVCR